MNRNRKILVALAALVVLVGGGLWWRHGAVAAPKYRTEAAVVGGIVSVVSATGTVTPVEQVEIGSQVSGVVQRLNADYNSRVHKGQVLLQIDPSTFRARAVQAQAAVLHADAVAGEMKRALDRARALLPEKYIAQADVDAAQSKSQQANADLQQARAQSQAAQVDLANTTIRSPIDGVVIARAIDLGQTVAASLTAPKLFVIANDLSHMQVETKIDEADIGTIRPGLPVTFTVDAFPDQQFAGIVSQVRLEPLTEQNVVTYTTVIRTENPALRLRPGMTANVSVQVASRDEVLKVPNSALRFRPPAAAGAARGAGRGAASAADVVSGGGGGRGGAGAAGDSLSGGRRWGGRGTGTGRWSGSDSTRAGRRMGGPRGGGSANGAAIALPESGAVVMGTVAEPRMKRGAVYVLKNGKPELVAVRTGITDGAMTEVISDQLQAGDLVIIGVEATGKPSAAGLAPPPGLGGRGGGGRGGR